METFEFIAKVGTPVAAAMGGGYLVFLTLKFILAGVMSSIQQLSAIIVNLDHRVKTMNHDVIRIDTTISQIIGVKPDTARLGRISDPEDHRKD